MIGRQLSRASLPRSRACAYNIAHDHEFLTLDIPDVEATGAKICFQGKSWLLLYVEFWVSQSLN